MSTIYLSFAGMIGSVKAENEINVTRNFLPFLEEPQNTDYSFEYISCEKLGNLQGNCFMQEKNMMLFKKKMETLSAFLKIIRKMIVCMDIQNWSHLRTQSKFSI